MLGRRNPSPANSLSLDLCSSLRKGLIKERRHTEEEEEDGEEVEEMSKEGTVIRGERMGTRRKRFPRK